MLDNFHLAFPPLRHNFCRSRLLTNMYIFVMELKDFPFVTNLRKPGCETITSSWINWRAARFDDLSQWKQVDSASCLKEIQLMSVYTLYRRFLIFGILASIHRCYGFTSELVTCPNVIKLCLFSWFLKLECADYKVLDSTVFIRVYCALFFYKNNHQNRGAYNTRIVLFVKQFAYDKNNEKSKTGGSVAWGGERACLFTTHLKLMWQILWKRPSNASTLILLWLPAG